MNPLNVLVELFQQHRQDLRRSIAARFSRVQHEAEDIVQDAFHNLLRMDGVEHLENPKAYLYQTAANLALNRIRKSRYQQAYSEQQLAEDVQEHHDLSPERQLLARRDLKRIEQALVDFPEKYTRTFLLSRVQDKSYKEISEQLNIAESTVEKHIIKTLKYLREHLSGEESL